MEYNSDFRYDLKRGQDAEKWLAGLLESDAMEVKRDFIASKSNRVFVEVACSGKPSGIMTTEADHWGFVLDDCAVLIPVTKLLPLVERAIDEGRYRNGGDGNRSVGALIPLVWLTKFLHLPPSSIEESTVNGK